MSSIEILGNYWGHAEGTNWKVLERNALSGLGMQTIFYNASGKDIKYVTFTYAPYNQVNDIVTDQYGGTIVSKKHTGPIESGAMSIATFDGIWYDDTITEIILEKVSIDYMDGTSEEIAGSDLVDVYESITSNGRERSKAMYYYTACRFFGAFAAGKIMNCKNEVSNTEFINIYAFFLAWTHPDNLKYEKIIYNPASQLAQGLEEKIEQERQRLVKEAEDKKRAEAEAEAERLRNRTPIEKAKDFIAERGCGFAIGLVIGAIVLFGVILGIICS